MWRFLGRMARAIFSKNDEGSAFSVRKTAERLLREKIHQWQRHALQFEQAGLPRHARRCRDIASALRTKLVRLTYTEAA